MWHQISAPQYSTMFLQSCTAAGSTSATCEHTLTKAVCICSVSVRIGSGTTAPFCSNVKIMLFNTLIRMSASRTLSPSLSMIF